MQTQRNIHVHTSGCKSIKRICGSFSLSMLKNCNRGSCSDETSTYFICPRWNHVDMYVYVCMCVCMKNCNRGSCSDETSTYFICPHWNHVDMYVCMYVCLHIQKRQVRTSFARAGIMWICMYVCLYAYIEETSTYFIRQHCNHVDMYVCMYVCMCSEEASTYFICPRLNMWICMYVGMYVCMHVYVYVCVCRCPDETNTCKCVCMYI